MIHSRPGFASRKSDQVPAKLQPDMVPALHRKSRPDTGTPLTLEGRLEAHKRAHAQTDTHVPEVIVNPAPSEPPLIQEPGK